MPANTATPLRYCPLGNTRNTWGYAYLRLTPANTATPLRYCPLGNTRNLARYVLVSLRAYARFFSSIKKAPSHYPFLRDTDVERSHESNRTQNSESVPHACREAKAINDASNSSKCDVTAIRCPYHLIAQNFYRLTSTNTRMQRRISTFLHQNQRIEQTSASQKMQTPAKPTALINNSTSPNNPK